MKDQGLDSLCGEPEKLPPQGISVLNRLSGNRFTLVSHGVFGMGAAYFFKLEDAPMFTVAFGLLAVEGNLLNLVKRTNLVPAVYGGFAIGFSTTMLYYALR